MNKYSNNTRIECTQNCGNSPKQKLIKELSIAFAHNEIGFCMDWMTDDVVLDIAGNK